jgi:hypothetical protein
MTHREYRYQRNGSDYILQCWYEGRETTQRGDTSEHPEWLSNVLAVAKAGGHIQRPKSPPPDDILWFRTTPDGDLITFLELSLNDIR